MTTTKGNRRPNGRGSPATRPEYMGPNYKSAEDLALSTAPSVRQGGVITRLPAAHELAHDGYRRTPIQAAPTHVEAPMHQPNVGNVNINTSALDRAKAFITSTAPMGLITTIIALLMRLYWMRLPFWALDTLYVALTGYATAWVLNWLLYHIGSPEIRMIWNSTMQTMLSFRIIRAHQEERMRERQDRKETDIYG